jgi:hypothetical protein
MMDVRLPFKDIFSLKLIFLDQASTFMTVLVSKRVFSKALMTVPFLGMDQTHIFSPKQVFRENKLAVVASVQL